jgi:hypothetical protein
MAKKGFLLGMLAVMLSCIGFQAVAQTNSRLTGTWESTEWDEISCSLEFMEDGSIQVYQYQYFDGGNQRSGPIIKSDRGSGRYSYSGSTINITLQLNNLGTIRTSSRLRFNGNNEFVIERGLDIGELPSNYVKSSNAGYKLFTRSNW